MAHRAKSDCFRYNSLIAQSWCAATVNARGILEKCALVDAPHPRNIFRAYRYHLHSRLFPSRSAFDAMNKTWSRVSDFPCRKTLTRFLVVFLLNIRNVRNARNRPWIFSSRCTSSSNQFFFFRVSPHARVTLKYYEFDKMDRKFHFSFIIPR